MGSTDEVFPAFESTKTPDKKSTVNVPVFTPDRGKRDTEQSASSDGKIALSKSMVGFPASRRALNYSRDDDEENDLNQSRIAELSDSVFTLPPTDIRDHGVYQKLMREVNRVQKVYQDGRLEDQVQQAHENHHIDQRLTVLENTNQKVWVEEVTKYAEPKFDRSNARHEGHEIRLDDIEERLNNAEANINDQVFHVREEVVPGFTKRVDDLSADIGIRWDRYDRTFAGHGNELAEHANRLLDHDNKIQLVKHEVDAIRAAATLNAAGPDQIPASTDALEKIISQTEVVKQVDAETDRLSDWATRQSAACAKFDSRLKALEQETRCRSSIWATSFSLPPPAPEDLRTFLTRADGQEEDKAKKSLQV